MSDMEKAFEDYRRLIADHRIWMTVLTAEMSVLLDAYENQKAQQICLSYRDRLEVRIAELEAETTNWAKTHLQRLDENEAQRVQIELLQATVEAQTQRITELTEAHKDEQATVEVQARRIEQLKAAEKHNAELVAALNKIKDSGHDFVEDSGVCASYCSCCAAERALKGGAK